MLQRFSLCLDWLSNFLAHRKGLLPLIGLVLILINFILSLLVSSWVTTSNLFLHLGLVVAIFGFLLAWAL
jgi:hypothetical protein